jgi:drug/metabolite transporter (DMT)-like permease
VGLVFLLYALAASTMTMQKCAVFYFHPLIILAVRSLAGGTILFILHRLMHGSNPLRLLARHPFSIFKLALLVTVTSPVIKVALLRVMTSVKVGFFYFIDPIFTVFLVYCLYGTRIRFKQFIGILVASGGILIVLLEKGGSEGLMLIGRFSWAEALLVFAYVANRYGWLRIQEFVRSTGCGAKELNSVMMLVGGLITVCAIPFFAPLPAPSEWYYGGKFLIGLVLITNVIGYTLCTYLYRFYSATFMSLASLTRPLWIAVFGVLFLHETLSWTFALAVLFVLIGLSIFYFDELRTLRVKAKRESV